MPSKMSLPVQDQLRQAGLEVLLPTDEGYTQRQESYFSKTASELTPACIVRARSSADVSATVRILSESDTPFAVRSGGHAPLVGSSNIGSEGVTLDLGLLNWTRVLVPTDPDQDEWQVDIGPGARWTDVYSTLEPHGLSVAGGREGGVGVGGLILGGGNTYFSASEGWACDNVLSFEIVLAPNGNIVVADGRAETADLFWALKGGGNNFGVVTNFRMRGFRGRKNVWGGLRLMPWDTREVAADALVDFTGGIKGEGNRDGNLLVFYMYRPEIPQNTVLAVFAQMAGAENAPAYEKFLGMPCLHTDVKKKSLADMVGENTMPTGYFSIWFTGTFINDSRIVKHAASLHEKLVKTLKTTVAGDDGDFWALTLFQPLPKIIATAGRGRGGNALGVEYEHDGLILQTTVMVRTAEQKVMAYPHCKKFLEDMREFASCLDGRRDGNLPWEYVNYADATQNPLKSYGEENVRRLKEVARKYDPTEVFQKLCKGGFKISDV
ncbi:hypothetical protein QBC35DRAFT_48231 [Podospora australis]|uniref:FAD-binding PCMH-type domain-containing protein n=1 Tax=Podospora australis TaxID=1536484 RepID=A0AAN6WM39_9PEZI|nr:hypothetical protein QBC35DRAFT_48231 [Podospora australis]